jgi:magnesium chelatase subunit I
MNIQEIKTLGALKKQGYVSKRIKAELRDNLMEKLKQKAPLFEGIIGYEDTVIPQLIHAILSEHNINLLGLRGQAKTRIARSLTDLLDEYIPIVEGSEINDDPNGSNFFLCQGVGCKRRRQYTYFVGASIRSILREISYA